MATSFFGGAFFGGEFFHTQAAQVTYGTLIDLGRYRSNLKKLRKEYEEIDEKSNEAEQQEQVEYKLHKALLEKRINRLERIVAKKQLRNDFVERAIQKQELINKALAEKQALEAIRQEEMEVLFVMQAIVEQEEENRRKILDYIAGTLANNYGLLH